MNEDESAQNHEKPVAYDANGRPLYSHPAESGNSKASGGDTRVVHMSRPIDPEKPVISEATRAKHARSNELYPNLNLSDGEYVISAVRRHPIGLVLPLFVGVLLISIAFTILFNFDLLNQFLSLNNVNIGFSTILPPTITFALFIVIATYVTYYVYTNNRFFLTNESVIQEIQTGLFSKLEQTVSLSNIEDASFTQVGILQQILNYGSIRLSTEGDETTYRFSYVANPKHHIAILNNAIEAFQNGRPVDN